jgi:hypothetical protein
MTGEITAQQLVEWEYKWLTDIKSEVARSSKNMSILNRDKLSTISKALSEGNVDPDGLTTTEDDAKESRKQTGRAFYKWNKRFQLVKVGEEQRVYYQADEGTPLSELMEVISVEDAFTILKKIHIENGHPKGRTLHNKVKGRYGKSITQAMSRMFSDLCPMCQSTRRKSKSHRSDRAMLKRGFCAEGQIGLIDYQHLAEQNAGMKWLLVYQDVDIRFVATAALKENNAEHVARALLDIFCLIGRPGMLRSDCSDETMVGPGSEGKLATFSEDELTRICGQLSLLWPGTLIRPNKPNTASEEPQPPANKRFKQKLEEWMASQAAGAGTGRNKGKEWSLGHMLIRAQLNCECPSAFGTSSYRHVFGREMIFGSSSSSSSSSILVQEEHDHDRDRPNLLIVAAAAAAAGGSVSGSDSEDSTLEVVIEDERPAEEIRSSTGPLCKRYKRI